MLPYLCIVCVCVCKNSTQSRKSNKENAYLVYIYCIMTIAFFLKLQTKQREEKVFFPPVTSVCAAPSDGSLQLHSFLYV